MHRPAFANSQVDSKIVRVNLVASEGKWCQTISLMICLPVCITPSWKTRSLLLSDLVSCRPGKRDDCDLTEKGEKQASTPRRKLSASLCCMIARIPFTWRDRLAVSEPKDDGVHDGCRKAPTGERCLSLAKVQCRCACLPAVPH